MPRPTCAQCEREMKTNEIGVYVVETMGKERTPYRLWAADLYRCPICGAKVVAGYANMPFYPERMEEFIESATETIVYSHEYPKQ